MKNLVSIAVFFISVYSFAQSNTTLNGMVTDLESNNAPLMYAKVMVKETGVETLSNENGFFKFENLQAGNYTLVYSFTGYETKAVKIEVKPEKINNAVTMAIGATSVSLEDLMAVLASVETPTDQLNN